MQYYTHPQNSNIQEIISSITKILSNVRVKAIRLIGGEPLISKDLPEIIDFISNKYDDRYDAIQIYTNATIVPNNKLLNAAKASGRTSFYISDYKDLSRHKAEVVDLLKKHSIRFALESQLTWQDCGNIHPYDNTQINYKYSNCCVNKAFSIIGTKLYSCPFSANFHNIYAGESCSTRDCIELNEINDTEFKVAICDLLMNQTPLSACYFCKGRDYTVTEVPAAVQTREILTRS
jgi:hypothetical protein